MTKITMPIFKKAAKGSKGIVNYISKRIGCSRNQVYEFIRKNAEAQKIIGDEREILKDDIESKLIVKIAEGDNWALGIALKTICKDRGYAPEPEIAINVNNDNRTILFTEDEKKKIIKRLESNNMIEEL